MTLQDICEFIVDCPHSTAPDEGEGYPLIRTPNIGRGRLELEGVQRVSKEVYDKRNRRAIPRADDIIFAREAPAGNAAIIKGDQEVCLGQRTVLIRPDKNQVEPQYLVYYLLAPEQQYLLLGTANGATVAHVNIPTIKELPVNLPDMGQQIKIADILSAYDDLIENNQRQIKLLGEAAQRLYKEWFVDLRFPGYEELPVVDGVPEGWAKAPLGRIINYEIGGGWGEEAPTEKCEKPAYVIRGTDMYGMIHGDMYGIPYRYHEMNNLNARELIDGDIIFEVSGGSKTEGVARTLLIRQSLLEAFHSPVICASFCKLIRLESKEYVQYLYDTFKYLRDSGKTTEFDKRSASSIVNYRWKDFLSQQEVLLPCAEVLEQYNAVAEKLYNEIIVRSKQIEVEKKSRDRLLPKLMSGELEV